MLKTVQMYNDTHALAKDAANIFEQIVLDSVRERGRFICALSGGGTPTSLYQILAQPPYSAALPWDRMYFFWGDERCVPPDDSGSNYYQARMALLSRVPVPEQNIIRAKGELSPQLAAEDYTLQLQAYAAPEIDWPRFDLILLGLGADGHTASLFPGSPVASDRGVIAVTANYQDRPANRISFTPLVINAARNVMFLATGAEKASALAATINGVRDPVKFPAQRIQLENGKVWYMVDQAAAKELPSGMDGVLFQQF